jgi:hypothetical protein
VISICDDFSLRNVPITAKDSAISSLTDSEKYEEIERYFGICSKFAKSVLHYHAYDPFVLARAYFGWSSWMKSNTKIFRFGIGNFIEVDISDEACSSYGVYPGQKFISPLGDGQILGLDSISKKIVIKFTGKDSHEFCDKLRLQSFKLKECEKLSEFEEKWRSVKNIRKECADLSFENFMKLANSHKSFDIDKLIVQHSNLLSSNAYVFTFLLQTYTLCNFRFYDPSNLISPDVIFWNLNQHVIPEFESLGFSISMLEYMIHFKIISQFNFYVKHLFGILELHKVSFFRIFKDIS